MRALLLLAVAGCHAGIGPVLAFSTREGRVRLGLEGTGGAAFVRAAVGVTTGLSDQPQRRSYVTFDPGYPLICGAGLDDGGDCFGPGASIGLARGDQGGGLAAGFWGFWLRDLKPSSECVHSGNSSTDVFLSVALGYRYLAGVSELFVTPKISVVGIPCLD